MEIDKVFTSDVDGVADNLFSAVKNSVSEIKAMQQRKAAENVQLVIQALKKIESDLQDKFDGVTTVIEKRVSTIKDGRDGINGRDGRDGKEGRPGKDGLPGRPGKDGMPGRDGVDGQDGVSVTDARIDFDGSLIIGLSSGREINVGEVVAPDLAERIKVITNGGGTSQSVLDTLASLQAQINALDGFLDYKGTWNASTNTPTLVSSTGTKGDYYVVSVAGSTNLNGETTWGVGDWVVFNNSVWQKVDGGSTGNFTNITASGTVTLSGGTANGVAYLNGSKVLTTDTSLTYNGTNLGIGTASPSRSLSIYQSVPVLQLANSTTGSGLNDGFLILVNGSDAYISNQENAPIIFEVNQTEQMRLTSTGLGIGTSSPGYKLEVNGGASDAMSLFNSTNANGAHLRFAASGTVKSYIGGAPGFLGSSTADDLGIRAVGSVLFATNGSSVDMRLDSSGNLGLGVTPSAWRSIDKVLQVNRISLYDENGNSMYLGHNFFENSSGQYIYLNTDFASYYQQIDSQHRWYTAPSGTAGNAITFTQAMTLDASGRLLVGGTSAVAGSAKGSVDISNTSGDQLSLSRFTNASGVAAMYFNKSRGAAVGTNTIVQSGDGLGGIYFRGANGTGYSEAAYILAQVDGTPGASADMPGRLVFATSADGSATPTERARIDSSGNLFVNGTTQIAGAKLNVRGTNSYIGVGGTVEMLFGDANSSEGLIGSFTNHPITFRTNNTERARITSAGNFVAGGSAALATNATDGFLYVPTCAGTPTGTPTAITGMAPIVVNTTNNKLYFYSGGAWRDAGP